MGQRFPLPVTSAMVTPSNPRIGYPRHSNAADWAGGARGDDVDVATANVALARADSVASEPDYTPRTQAAKATALGTTMVEDISRARGWIAPGQPLAAKPAAPVVSSISPTTAPAASLPLMVTITGTGFSPWSTVYTGGMTTPEAKAEYVSPTQMKVPVWAAAPGTVSVAVEDHNVLSNVDKLFTVT